MTDRQVGADGEVRHPHVQQRQIVRVHKERDARLLRLVEDPHRVRVQRAAQHLVQELGRAHGELQVKLRVFPPLQRPFEFLLTCQVSIQRVLLAADLAALHVVDDDVEDAVPVLLPERHDARVKPGGVALHPALDLLASRDAQRAPSRELPEQVQHVLEEVGLGAAGASVHGEPELTDGGADGDGAAQVEIDELAAGVVHVIEQSDGGVVAPGERLEGLPPADLALVERQGLGPLAQLLEHPLADPDARLDLVLRVAHDLFQLRILFEERLEKPVGFDGDRDAIQLLDRVHRPSATGGGRSIRKLGREGPGDQSFRRDGLLRPLDELLYPLDQRCGAGPVVGEGHDDITGLGVDRQLRAGAPRAASVPDR